MYQHLDNKGKVIGLPAGKTVCVGRNYLDHIQELNNEVPEQPLLFIKPSTALVTFAGEIRIPTDLGACHNELEIAVLIGQTLSHVAPEQAMQAVWGYGLGLDLTLRDVQDKMKAKGQPWERAKAFDGSCPLSGFVPAIEVQEPQHLSFNLWVNEQVCQQGNAALMIHNMAALISEISRYFTLLPGDVVLTGTPKGVGPLLPEDSLKAELCGYLQVDAQVRGVC
ncbi:fumarylacetoacetate hydrolase family protein [Bowmanella denitrificans]|uniref:fumarylacetoacetate hydrolase family protein n=1 Tax=Bowmanella denitrificans TaxID=366582 RepID=UPI000C9B4ED9|nr:fumarylacetoacetate hydrolase family protein [Bowmanella denitrificans]